MTPGGMRVALAGWAGAKIISKKFDRMGGKQTGYKWAWNGDEQTPCAPAGGGLYGWGWNSEASIEELPNYPGDLNAVAQLEARLTDVERTVYLSFLTKKDQRSLTETWFPAVTATAPQRCEALCRTLGLWT